MSEAAVQPLPISAPSLATTCPVCGSVRLESIVDIPNVPVHAAVLYHAPHAARAVERGHIRLTACRACSYVWNARYDPDIGALSGAYDASLDASTTYQRFLRETAQDLARSVREAPYLDGPIVEVGGGAGYFLRMLCRESACDGVGIDPTGPRGGFERLNGTRGSQVTISWENARLGEEHAGFGARLAVCRQMAHYLTHPRAFARKLRSALAPGALAYIEVPNARYIFESKVVWTVFYEHVGYYTGEALAAALAPACFSIRGTAPAYVDDQYVQVRAVANARPGTAPVSAPCFLEHVRTFGRAYARTTAAWRARLAAWRASRKRAVLWGAAGRGVAFMTAVEDLGAIEAVVDNNPKRHGTFMPGSGCPVVAPEALVADPPDVVILTNETYRDEIVAQLRSLVISPEIVVAR